MALDLDPLYHTETMVLILREQGSTLSAMELAEKILEKDPENASVKQLLEEMKSEARASFERFRQGGGVKDKAEEAPSEIGKEAVGEQVENNVVSLEEKRESRDPRQKKIERLRSLLARVKVYRENHG